MTLIFKKKPSMQPEDSFIFNITNAASLGSLLHIKMYIGKILPETQLPSSAGGFL